MLDPSTERVKYICPAWDHHGHWVLKEDGTKVVTRYVIRKLKEPVTEDTWIALEQEVLDAQAVRRRMREKSTPLIRKIEVEEEQRREEEISEAMREGVIARVIEEEMMKMVDDEVKTVQEEFQVLAGLKKALEKPWEEEEILQTKIVSPQEVQQNWPDWESAAKDEIRSLLEEKEALEEVSREKVEETKRRLEEEGRKIETIPSKVVFTRKPGPKGGKAKVRWVVCGKFEAKKPEEENFSSGADATAFRLMVHLATQHQWEGTTLDVKTAFLNASWDDDAEDTTILIKPPPILVEMKALPQGACYLPRKAVYGFRRSPRKDPGDEAYGVRAEPLENRGEGPRSEGQPRVVGTGHDLRGRHVHRRRFQGGQPRD